VLPLRRRARTRRARAERCRDGLHYEVDFGIGEEGVNLAEASAGLRSVRAAREEAIADRVGMRTWEGKRSTMRASSTRRPPGYPANLPVRA
jgi:hypothetical protein